MRKIGQKGFTLVEVVIVIALFAIMLTIAGYYMGGQGNKARLKSAARDLVSNMTLARVSAIRDTRPWAILFEPGNDRYIVYNYCGEDPANPVHWNDGDEAVFRSITLPQNVSFASNKDGLDGNPVADPVSYDDYVDPDGNPLVDLVIFNPDGTSSEGGKIYLTIPSGETFAVSNLRATGRIKAQRDYGSGWSD